MWNHEVAIQLSLSEEHDCSVKQIQKYMKVPEMELKIVIVGNFSAMHKKTD